MTHPPPRIALLATGGTISMRQQDGRGVVPALRAADLARYLPSGQAQLSPIDLFHKPSPSLSLTDIQTLADLLQDDLSLYAEGAIITHGTDTLEESAFALSLMTRLTFPVVVTGAMRPDDDLDADGPSNLEAALQLVTQPRIVPGIYVVMSNTVHAAQHVQKVATCGSYSFSSSPFEPLGRLTSREMTLRDARPFRLPLLEVRNSVPTVPIIAAGIGLEGETLEMLNPLRVGGLVVAGAGGGNVSASAVDHLEQLAIARPIALTSRTAFGRRAGVHYGYPGSAADLIARGLIDARAMSPFQARILLQLLLASGRDHEEVRLAFAAVSAALWPGR